MLLWFVATSIGTVRQVFRDDRFDYRLLVIGAILPDVVDAPTGGTWVLHSVVSAACVLLIVMLVTKRRSGARRTLLALPIGLFLHLVFDGAFALERSFWWPASGLSFPAEQLPVVQRGVLNVVLEIVGALLLVWYWRRFALGTVDARRRFVRAGELSEPASRLR